MLINKLFIPLNELLNSGLDQIEMNRLGSYVALTGKNGAGKTRILHRLINCIHNRNSHIAGIEQTKRSIQDFINVIKLRPNDPLQPSWQEGLASHNRIFDATLNRVFSDRNEHINIIHFVPKQLNLQDARHGNRHSLIQNYQQAKNPGIQNLESTCFYYIQHVQDREWAASHQRSTHLENEKKEAKEDYESLVKLIKQLLKCDLDRSIDSDATIFGKPLAEAQLSDGQIIIIQLIVALHAQSSNLSNSVFIMDEPENHLHPSALIEFLDALLLVAENSQFWISTHSVPLLAHIAQREPSSIWYVEDGKVSNAGNNPIKVLSGLLGNDDQIQALSNFTSLPAQFAAINYATECLLPPKVIGTNQNDPQVAQIRDFLQAEKNNSKTVVLDYGAGKCRLLSGLNELANNQNLNLPDYLEYYAFDPSPSDQEIGSGAISEVYGTETNRYFSTKDLFFSEKDEQSIDVVVLCNVLHEISPSEWIALFNDQSLIGRSLKETGHILIVEDQRIPQGEKAHQYGFIVLDTAHLKTLFQVKEADISSELFKSFDYRGDGRLKAHSISKGLLSRLNGASRKKAIEELKSTAENYIKHYRIQEPNYKNGQLHGFWTQQFANASLYLSEQ